MHRLAAILLALAAIPARADDAPCKATGDTVTCERAGFDALVKRCIDRQTEVEVCRVRLDAMTKDRDAVQSALDSCVSRPPAQPIVTPLRALSPVLAGVLGAVIASSVVALDVPSSGRVVGVAVGLSLVGVGVVLAIP